ncbi:hypothetical protein [Asticcacaulis sp.]|uniref:hypothetical protein n=1 Tax=Asticcacaulis sp. TaxID=1872648 RepID=UPI003F7B96DE
MPTIQDFRDYIRRTKLKAADQGLSVVRLDAEGILICVAGPLHSLTNASFSRRVMEADFCQKAMQAEIGPDDQVVVTSNVKSNLTVDYQV